MATLIGNANDGGRSNTQLAEFTSGNNDRYAPLTDRQRKALRFTAREFGSQVDRDHALQKNLETDPVSYFRELEELQDHPGLSPMMRDRVKNLMSRPGPQTGGSSTDLSRQFGIY